jgi:hypothetical protein
LMINNNQPIKSTSAFRTYDLILGFIIVFIAIGYALINLYLYKQIGHE